MSASGRSSAKRSDIIRIKRPSSVDPKQPNISYRIPRVSGYHSRCSSPADEMHDQQDYFSRHPSQVKLTAIFPESRKEVRSTKKMQVGTKNHLTEKFMKKTIGYQYNYHVAEFKSKVVSPRSQILIPESQNMMSQRERMELEVDSMSKTKMTKRLAQIVPHRIDQPYYMAGSTAMLSKRYEVDEEDFERLKLRADSRASRASSGSGRRRHHARDNINQNARANETPLIPSCDQNKDESDADSNERLKGRIITTGKFARNQDSTVSLTEGMDLEFSQLDRPDFCILSKKQKKAFEGMFNDVDFNSNGKVTSNELMHRLFSNVSKKDAKLLMQIFDMNKDKTIDRREFLAICALNDRICGFRTESKNDSLRLDVRRLSKLLVRYKELLALLDQDDNNQIHVDEVMLIMTTAMGKEIGMNETIARSVIDYIDKDRNGYIDFVSFITHIPFFLKLYKSMMDSTDIELQELENSRELIRNNLRKTAKSGLSKR